MEEMVERETNKVANWIRYTAIGILVLAVIAGIISAMPPSHTTDMDFKWVPALTFWASGTLSFVIMYGFAELIDINADSRRMLAEIMKTRA